MDTRFRDLPSVSDVLDDERIRGLVREYTHGAVLGLVRAEIDRARYAIRNGSSPQSPDLLIRSVERRADIVVALSADIGHQRDRRDLAHQLGTRSAQRRCYRRNARRLRGIRRPRVRSPNRPTRFPSRARGRTDLPAHRRGGRARGEQQRVGGALGSGRRGVWQGSDRLAGRGG